VVRDAYRETTYAYRILVRKPKSPLGTPTRRRDDNIKADLQERVLEDIDWISLAQHGVSGGLM
jgi:hypothetical protein